MHLNFRSARPALSPLLLLALMTLALPSHAQTRRWHKLTGSGTFEAELLSSDSSAATIQLPNGQTITVPLEKFHADDRAWIEAQRKQAPPVVFDTLSFGDTRQEVEKKLLASKWVEPAVDAVYLGRLGLNRSFRTRETIGGLKCELSFDWDAEGKLNEITLQTQRRGSESYATTLHQTWQELIKLMTRLYGKPLQNGEYPRLAELSNGVFLGSHLWKIADVGSAILGTSMDENGYQVSVRFTTQDIKPVRKD